MYKRKNMYKQMNIFIYIYKYKSYKPLRNSVGTHPRCITSTHVKLWPDSDALRSVVPVLDLRRGIGPSDHHWSLVKGGGDRLPKNDVMKM